MFCNFRTSTTTDDNGGGGASGTKPTAVTTSEDSSDESPSSDSDEESEDSSEEPPVTSPNASPKVNKTLQNIVRCQFLVCSVPLAGQTELCVFQISWLCMCISSWRMIPAGSPRPPHHHLHTHPNHVLLAYLTPPLLTGQV